MRMEWQGEPAYAHILLDVTEEKLKQGKLEQEAYFDRLTSIGNRYYFHKKMNELLETNTQLVFCYCDLDPLKHVNDTYGHAEGDWYLCHFVKTVKKQIRDQDLFARLGGDEFCLILKNCPLETARKKIYQIQTLFSEESTQADALLTNLPAVLLFQALDGMVGKFIERSIHMKFFAHADQSSGEHVDLGGTLGIQILQGGKSAVRCKSGILCLSSAGITDVNAKGCSHIRYFFPHTGTDISQMLTVGVSTQSTVDDGLWEILTDIQRIFVPDILLDIGT